MLLSAFPVLLLVTSIGSGLLYQRTENDIFKVLAIASAVACLMWGLVIAHWSIHLLGLILLLKLRTPLYKAIEVKVSDR